MTNSYAFEMSCDMFVFVFSFKIVHSNLVVENFKFENKMLEEKKSFSLCSKIINN